MKELNNGRQPYGLIRKIITLACLFNSSNLTKADQPVHCK